MRGGKLYALVLSSIVSIAMSLPRLRNLLFVGLLLLVGGALLASYLLSWHSARHCKRRRISASWRSS
ncbi:hypothetical protein ACLBTQ_30675, partial [Pseudomonas aeruginosa]